MASTSEQIKAFSHEQRRATRRRQHETDTVFLDRLKRKYGAPKLRTLSKAQKLVFTTPKARAAAMKKGE